jgi:hypothetical protein
LPELAARSYVWKPDFAARYLLFDFSTLEAQYAATAEWASRNSPIPLGFYLELRARPRTN